MRAPFVCFIGIDGSGKTPHARALVKSMNEAGTKCEYVWARWSPVALKPVQFLFRKIHLKATRADPKNHRSYLKQKRRVLGNHLIASIWKYLVMLDYTVQVAPKLRLALSRGTAIVCDRYIYDTLVDLSGDFVLSQGESRSLLSNPFLHLLPKPNIVFLLDVPETVACQRKGDLGLLDYLSDLRKRYMWLAPVIHALILNGCGDFADVHESIMDGVNSVTRSS